MIAGSLHGLIIWFQRFALGRLTFHSRDAIWMAPLGTALLFGGLALVAVLPALLLRWRIPVALAVGGAGFLAVFTLLLPYGAITRWAAALLALGVGVQLGRAARRAPDRWLRRIVRGGAGFALMTFALGIGQRGLLVLRQALGLRALPAAPANAPNILLIILDTVRGESLSLYGYQRPTSAALEKWAARGVVFDHAIATAPWTLPSHGSLFTGEPGHRIRGGWVEPISDAVPTLAELLRDQGYRTGGFVANLGYTSSETGLARGFLEYRDYPLSLTQLFLHVPLVQTALFHSVLDARSLYDLRQAFWEFNLQTERPPGNQFVHVPARDITDAMLRWQERVQDRPFFAVLNYFDAHAPYRSPAAFQARFAPTGRKRDRYDAAIAYLDAELDRLLRTLEERGVLDRTIVVVTSDHGEQFGEHGLPVHANSLYLPLLRVPLVLLYPPRVPAGVRVLQPVSLRDVPATILALAANGPSRALPGTSLVASWDQAKRVHPPSAAISYMIQARRPTGMSRNAKTWIESILDGHYHYIRSGLGAEELYAWRTDSLEQVNLAESPEGRSAIKRLRAQLEADR